MLDPTYTLSSVTHFQQYQRMRWTKHLGFCNNLFNKPGKLPCVYLFLYLANIF